MNQLADVQPTDWAYQALQSLVERYGCIAGYPDGSYRGDRALTRYEFAAGVNACLDRITEIISSTTADLATKEDLATLQRLQAEFAAELSILRNRVDSLEARTAELEANQFSTTTTLNGNVITTFATIFGDDETEESNQTVFQSRVQLNFDTSFTGSDRLRTRLEWGNYNSFNAPVNTRLSDLGVAFPSQDFYVYSNTDDDLTLGFLEYSFPIGDRTTVFLEGRGAAISDIVCSASSFDSDFDSLSTFSYNPIYNLSPGEGIGAGVTVQLSDPLQLGVGYLSGEGNLSNPGAGLFNGDYSAFGQLTLTSSGLTAAATYVNNYVATSDASTQTDRQTLTNAYGLSAEYGFNPSFFLGGWVSYFDHLFIGEGSGTSWSYAAYLGLRNLGGEGNLLGVIVGVQPRLTESTLDNLPGEDASLHVEGFYKVQLNDNMALLHNYSVFRPKALLRRLFSIRLSN